MHLLKFQQVQGGIRLTFGTDTFEVSDREIHNNMGQWINLACYIEHVEQDARMTSRPVSSFKVNRINERVYNTPQL